MSEVVFVRGSVGSGANVVVSSCICISIMIYYLSVYQMASRVVAAME